MNRVSVCMVVAGMAAAMLVLSSGCRTISSGRAAFGSGTSDPYVSGEVPVAGISQTETDGALKPSDIQGDEAGSYQKFIIPAGYKDPTEGLEKRSGKDVPEYKQVSEPASEDASAVEPAAEDGFVIYKVKSGDSLSVIANSRGVRTAELAKINGIPREKWNKIRIGQKLKIPTGRKPFKSGPAAAGAADVGPGKYKVVSGDALSVIALRFKVKTSDLVKENNLKSADSIYVGQILKIPGQGKASAIPEVKKTAAPPVAKPSETQPTAAKPQKAVDSVDAPVAAPAAPEISELPPLPELPESSDGGIDISALTVPNALGTLSSVQGVAFDTMKVTEGQTLESIALRYSCTKEELLRLNSFPADKVLKKDDVIKVPRN